MEASRHGRWIVPEELNQTRPESDHWAGTIVLPFQIGPLIDLEQPSDLMLVQPEFVPALLKVLAQGFWLCCVGQWFGRPEGH